MRCHPERSEGPLGSCKCPSLARDDAGQRLAPTYDASRADTSSRARPTYALPRRHRALGPVEAGRSPPRTSPCTRDRAADGCAGPASGRPAGRGRRRRRTRRELGAAREQELGGGVGHLPCREDSSELGELLDAERRPAGAMRRQHVARVVGLALERPARHVRRASARCSGRAARGRESCARRGGTGRSLGAHEAVGVVEGVLVGPVGADEVDLELDRDHPSGSKRPGRIAGCRSRRRRCRA